ncbi:hypothetical protein MnTg02_01139 [bacterium MnTg02]|nr:hypothetical protein MnTg02_01139 [bacterium MnTg02]
MERVFHYLTPIAVVVVLIILVVGLWNMLRGGNPGTSQRLMRWRVGLQFFAICVIMAAAYFMGK